MVFTLSIRYSCPILIIFEFSQQFFENTQNIKFLENPSSGSRVVPCKENNRRTEGETHQRTDIHDETNSRFSQLAKGSKEE